MHMYARPADKRFLGSLCVVLALAIALLLKIHARWGIEVLLVLLSTMIVAAQLEIFRRTSAFIASGQQQIQQAAMANYRQLEALFSLSSVLDLKAPLPDMREWAISPDFAKLIVSTIKDRKPKHVLELGSGVSTLIAGYALLAMSCGDVISLDHEERWARRSSDNLKIHELTSVATVVHAPLREVHLDGKSYLWYGTGIPQSLINFDMVVIDGPPADLQPLSRYPALPLLWNRLSPTAVILLDDAARPDEKEIVQKWMSQFPGLWCEEVETEKGAVVLIRGKETILSEPQSKSILSNVI